MKNGKIEHITVIGAGQMGFGIGLEFARFGYPVVLCDNTQSGIQKALERTEEDLELMVQAKLLTAKQAEATIKRISTTTKIEDAASDADYVVEAVPEILKLKQEIFARLDAICPPPAILSTNTSGLTISDIALTAKHQERIVGAHYFGPPHMVPLVEVSGGKKTDRASIERTAVLLRGLRKKVVVIDVEIPRFIGNRIQEAIMAEAKSLVDHGVCTPQMIDDVISFGFGRRMPYVGLFKRFDFVGLDVMYTIEKSWGEPWKTLAEHYKKGEMGIKTGKGYYDWPGDSGEKFQRHFKTELIRMMKQDMKDGNL